MANPGGARTAAERGTRSAERGKCAVLRGGRWPVGALAEPEGVHTFVLYCACARAAGRERRGKKDRRSQEGSSIGHHRWDWEAGRASGICRSAWTTAPIRAVRARGAGGVPRLGAPRGAPSRSGGLGWLSLATWLGRAAMALAEPPQDGECVRLPWGPAREGEGFAELSC